MSAACRSPQRGFSLIVVLLMLVIAMVLGIGAAQLSLVGERSARNNSWARVQGETLYPLGAEFSGTSFKPPADGRLRRTSTFTVMLRNVMKEPVP